MKIVLSGVETNNKGAELMFYAILQEIERKFPHAIVYIEKGSVPQGLQYIKTSLKLKLKPVEVAEKWFNRLHIFGILRRLHIFSPYKWFNDKYAISGTKFFINDSGYFYSDKWNLPNSVIDNRRELIKANHNAGAKVIFLPQAFGPITQINVQQGIKDLEQYADIVMPREEVSYHYLRESRLINMDKVHLFPDFTSLVEGEIPKDFMHLTNGVCIIPNIRMLDNGNITYNEYKKFIECIVFTCQSQGFTPYLLNHEGEDDKKLAISLQKEIKPHIEFVDDLNALQVKGLISTSYLVISSRFHGVASALNSCVPCLATSWGHKYEELFRDYNQFDCILDVNNKANITSKISEYLNKEKNSDVRKNLSKILPEKRQRSISMWNLIWES